MLYKFCLCDNIITVKHMHPHGSANVNGGQTLDTFADSFFYCYLLFILSHFLQNKIKNSFFSNENTFRTVSEALLMLFSCVLQAV